MERTLELQYDEVVVGADLSALLYAYKNNKNLVYIRTQKPYLYHNENTYEQKFLLWQKLMFLISYRGLCIAGDNCTSIRIEDEIINLYTKNNNIIKIKYDNIILSDDYGVSGLSDPIGKTDNNNLVVDFMAISQRYKTTAPISSFKKEQDILFDVDITNKYVLDRKHTLIIAKSKICDLDLKKEEFSENYMRLRLLRELYPKVKEMKHIRREIFSYGKNIYTDPKIKMLEDQLEIDHNTINIGDYSGTT